MFLAKSIEDININHIFQGEKIKNTIIEDSEFVKIFYSDKNIVLKGIIVICPLYVDYDNYPKNKVLLCRNKNKNIVQKIISLEESILNNFLHFGIPRYTISEQLANNLIPLYNQSKNKTNIKYIIKISGIWINNNQYGLTFKFLEVKELSIGNKL